MLGLLLDEHISPVVADQLRARSPSVPIHSIHQWRSGALCGMPDDRVLAAAAEEGLTLVTYDVTTIPPLLTEWAMEGRSHAGVILVDQRTIRPDDFGRLIRALALLWEGEHGLDWTNRSTFLDGP
jgi:hypothetical protein